MHKEILVSVSKAQHKKTVGKNLTLVMDTGLQWYSQEAVKRTCTVLLLKTETRENNEVSSNCVLVTGCMLSLDTLSYFSVPE